MSGRRPVLTVVAGPNGSGKSTLSKSLLETDHVPVIDPDAIARTLSPTAPQDAAFAAGREAIRLQREYLDQGVSFATETTLAGHVSLRLIMAAHQNNFLVHLIYICTESADLNVARVAERVARGGHPVPPDDLRRRYRRSLLNLLQAIHLSDTALLFDNSTERGPKCVLTIKLSRIITREPSLPHWLTTTLSTFLAEQSKDMP